MYVNHIDGRGQGFYNGTMTAGYFTKDINSDGNDIFFAQI